MTIIDKACWERGCPCHDIGDEGVEVTLLQPEQSQTNELKEAVNDFFTKYLNRVEESDSGRCFHPIYISCCRALMMEPLGQLLERMRVLSDAPPDPLREMK